ncbi:MAG TPA: dockerin type I domain-containing protein [Pirellulales bacterium]|nr:dockerin type I domain-containing protein [Pirellulales bacterium]
MQKKVVALTVFMALFASIASYAAADTTDALILNQANAVSGSKYLSAGKTDNSFGRVEGNGQNWMQLLVTKTDPGKNTLNLQGYQIDWSYNKDAQDFGSGVITFSNDPVWQSVPMGTAITINESQQAWYLINTPDSSTGNPDGDLPGQGGMQRDGQIDGLGVLHGTPYTGDPSVEKLLDFSSNTAWNPYAQATGNMQPGPNWNINVWAGQQSGGQFQYFSFSGSVTSGGVTSAIGTDAAGLFTVNNDNWQFTIKDAQGNVVEGPVGEAVSGWAAGGVNSQELIKLEAFATGTGATLSNYQNVNIANYADGSSSSYGGPTQWTGAGTEVQDLSPLRDWFNNIKVGDANLDGIVNSQDLAVVSSSWLKTGVGLLGGDINGDGIVNSQDLASISSNWLQTGGAPAPASANAASVPEPASYLLCAIGMVVGLLWRRLGS